MVRKFCAGETVKFFPKSKQASENRLIAIIRRDCKIAKAFSETKDSPQEECSTDGCKSCHNGKDYTENREKRESSRGRYVFLFLVRTLLWSVLTGRRKGLFRVCFWFFFQRFRSTRSSLIRWRFWWGWGSFICNPRGSRCHFHRNPSAFSYVYFSPCMCLRIHNFTGI